MDLPSLRRLGQLERWLLPPECLYCHEPLPLTEGDALVCDLCRTRWRQLPRPWCEVCGEPQPLALECRLCARWPPELGPVRSAVRFDPPVRALVHRLKYQGWSGLAEVFALSMRPLLQEFSDAAVLVPIPIAPKRRRRRGYNQAEELAWALSRQSGLKVAAELLHRTRETASQTRLSPEARLANLAEAFVASPTSHPVILVDDVFTTGATFQTAAVALLDAGVAEIGGLTFARAEAPLAEAAARM